MSAKKDFSQDANDIFPVDVTKKPDENIERKLIIPAVSKLDLTEDIYSFKNKSSQQ